MNKNYWVTAGCFKLNENFRVHQVGFLYWDKLDDKTNAWCVAYESNDGRIFAGTLYDNPTAYECEIVLTIPDDGYKLIPNVSSLNRVAKNSISHNKWLKDKSIYTSTPTKLIFDNMPVEKPSKTVPDYRYRDCSDWWLDPI